MKSSPHFCSICDHDLTSNVEDHQISVVYYAIAVRVGKQDLQYYDYDSTSNFQPPVTPLYFLSSVSYKGFPPINSLHLLTSAGIPSFFGNFSLIHCANNTAVYPVC